MSKVTLKVIDTQLATFTTNRDKLAGLAHTIAMMVFIHAAPKEVSPDCNGTGDATRALKLVKAMPKSWAAQMVLWFKEYTPVRIVPNNDKCEFDPKYKKLSPEDKLLWWKIEDANTNTFQDLSDEPEVKTTVYSFDDLVKMVQQLSKRIDKKLEADEIKPEDKLTAQALVLQLGNLKIEKIAPADEGANQNDKPAKVAVAA